MVYRPFRSIGRFVLAACAVSIGAASLNAQTVPSTTAPMGPNLSRIDAFAGYSYLGTHSPLQPGGMDFSSMNVGAAGSVAYYFSKYVGGEVLVTAHPSGTNDSLYTFSGGPVFRVPMQNFQLFAHGLAGGTRLLGPNSDAPATEFHNDYEWGVGLTAGGGMDYDLPWFNHKFSLRLFEADYKYVHTNFGPYTPPPTGGTGGGRANLNAVELDSGIVMHFGSIVPPPPVTYACVVSPSTVFPGDPVTVTGTPANLNPKKTPTYTWSADSGVTVTGTSSTGNIDTKTLAPGTYNVKGHVTEGKKPAESADCTATFTVKAFEPPTISCTANPSTVNPGDSSTITCNGVSPQNRPLTYSYSSTAGSISGNTSTATLSTTGAAPGAITVTGNVVDDKGQTASAMTTVTVQAPPPPPAPTTSALCSLSFERDARRPTRVDNEAKACLDDIALKLQSSSDAKLAIVGNADSKEQRHHMGKDAAERADNAKKYLVTDKGIDPSRITIYTGSTDAKTATTTLIPAGANFDSTGDTPVDEAALNAKPVHHHHKKK
jgi:outer membrane protein OmpA-like peptidoglycan-associated protein